MLSSAFLLSFVCAMMKIISDHSTKRAHQQNGLLQPTLRTLFMLNHYPHPHTAVTPRKVSTVRADCLPPPQHIKYIHYRGSPQFNSFVRKLLHSRKSISIFTTRSSTQSSWLLYKMKYPDAPFPINMAPSTDRSSTSNWVMRCLICWYWEPYLLGTAWMETSFWMTAMNGE